MVNDGKKVNTDEQNLEAKINGDGGGPTMSHSFDPNYLSNLDSEIATKRRETEKAIQGLETTNYDLIGETSKKVNKTRENMSQEIIAEEIDLERVPEFLRSSYQKIYSFFNSPDKIINDSEEGVRSLVMGLEEVKNDLTVRLYGKNNPLKNGKRQIGGLHEDYKTSVLGKYKVAKAITTVKDYIKDLEGYTQNYQEEMNKIHNDHETIGRIYDSIIATEQDSDIHRDKLMDLHNLFDKYELESSTLKMEIEETKNLRSYLNDIIQEARIALSINQSVNRNNDSAKIISENIPRLRESVEKYVRLTTIIRDYNYEEMVNIANMTSENPNINVGEFDERPSPFESDICKKEKNDEIRSAKIDDVLKNPLKGLYRNN